MSEQDTTQRAQAPEPTKTLGQVGFEAHNSHPGAHGPWKTFDGREIPRWEDLPGEAGALTRERWEVQAEVVGKEYMRRAGFEWEPVSCRYVQVGANGQPGQAINHSGVGA